MDLSKILSISGKPGLFKLIGESKSSIVVESLIDGKRTPAFSHERISTLKEISIYTETEDVALEDIFKKLYELNDAKPVLNPKKASANDLKALFEKILPDYDRDAVYTSDMKKVFGWYNFLLEKGILEFTEETAEEKPDEENAVSKTKETDGADGSEKNEAEKSE